MTICEQSETGRSFGAIGDYIHEIGCFCGCKEQNDDAVHKIGPFLGREGLNRCSGQKKGRLYGR